METLGTNTMRALALIVSQPGIEARVRQEIQENSTGTPTGVDRLILLEGCVQEAMRLWPTTPMLMRQTVEDDILGGNIIPAGTQVVILNGFNHRDWETNPDAGSFRPDFWLDKRSDYRFNHLSNGTQVCAGKSLALCLTSTMTSLRDLNTLCRLNRPKRRHLPRNPAASAAPVSWRDIDS